MYARGRGRGEGWYANVIPPIPPFAAKQDKNYIFSFPKNFSDIRSVASLDKPLDRDYRAPLQVTLSVCLSFCLSARTHLFIQNIYQSHPLPWDVAHPPPILPNPSVISMKSNLTRPRNPSPTSNRGAKHRYRV